MMHEINTKIWSLAWTSSKLPESLHLYSLTYIVLVRDCFQTGLLVSIICCQPFACLNFSPYTTPPTYHQRFLNICWQFKLVTYGYEQLVTDASKSNKQIYQNVWLRNIVLR